jgi:hypothetical protein
MRMEFSLLDTPKAYAILFAIVNFYQFFEVYSDNVELHVYEAREIAIIRL